MKRHEPMLVGDIIQSAMRRTGNEDTFERQRASALWPEVVGPSINRQTSRRWLNGSELHVAVTSAPLRNDLTFLSASILDKINSLAGRDIITKIVIH